MDTITEKLTQQRIFSTAQQFSISPIEDIIQDIKLGKMVILVDDPNRENEGDFVVSAQFLNEIQMTQMIRHGSGIVCCVIDEERRQNLGLNFQERRGRGESPNYVKFLTSVEATNGISTGVSARDRVLTIKALCAKDPIRAAISTPGHIFPLVGHPEGLKKRQGHTEASLALMKQAGLPQCAVLCEIMNDDGTMARMPQLIEIGRTLGLKIGTIDDLINSGQ